MKLVVATAALTLVAGAGAHAVTFSTFVTGGAIAAVEGQNNTIAYNYAGNKFVGSVYIGPNNLQLYSTDLTGHNVQKFGSPIPGSFSGEVVLAASLGQAGFPTGDIYAGAGSQLFHYANSGGAPSLFGAVPDGATVRQVFFDPGSSFGGTMLVTTSLGNIYKFDSAGTPTFLASTHEDTEGMDIATSAWGAFGGDLLVTSEGSGSVRLVSPTGVVSAPIATIPEAEIGAFVPLNLGASGNPLEGLYAANYPQDIQFADASQFAGLQGDAIITSEDPVNARVWDLHFNGVGFDPPTVIGNLPNQSEDGIFVTAQRIIPFVPEPASLGLLLSGIGALAGIAVRRRRDSQREIDAMSVE